MLSVRTLRAALTALVALIVAISLASCGGDTAGSAKADSGSASVGVLADAFPANTLGYLELTVRPDGELADNAKTIIGKLIGKSPDQVPAYLQKQLDQDPQPGEASWSDVKKVLGKHVAIGVLSIDGTIKDSDLKGVTAETAFVIEVTDAKAAEKLIAKEATAKALNGQRYYLQSNKMASAIVGDRMIEGMDESSLKAMLDGQKAAKHLSDTKGFEDAAGQVGGNPLLFAFAEAKPLLDRVRALATPDIRKQLDLSLKSYGANGLGSYGLTGTFAKRSIAIDFFTVGGKTDGPTTGAGDLIKNVPGDAWVAFGTSDLGKQLTAGLKQIKDLGTIDGTDIAAEIAKGEKQLGLNLEKDLFSWMGDVAIYARGTTADTANGALVVHTTNADASAQAIKDVSRLLGQADLAPKPVDLDGAKGISIAAGPVTAYMVQKGDTLTIASSEAAARDALAPKTTLGDSASFKAADDELDGVDPAVFLAFAPLIDLAKTSKDFTAEDRRVLEALDSVILGTKTDGDARHIKAALLVR